MLFPDLAHRQLYERFRLLDLMDVLGQATVTPTTPICNDPANDPTGCQRVSPAAFTIPENGDYRPVIFAHAPAEVAIPLQLPPEPTFLWLSPALDPLAWNWGGDGVTFQVWVQ